MKAIAACFIAVCAAVPTSVWAAPSAHEVVNAVTAEKAGSSQLKSEGAGGKLGQAMQEVLPSRLEVTAGTDGLIVLSDVSQQISLFAEVRYRLTESLQLGTSLAYRYQKSDVTSNTAFQVLVGPTFNFGSDGALNDSFFVSPQIGLTTGRTSFGAVVVGANTQLTLALHVGKRFAISESVAYAPSIGVVKEMDFSPSFVIQPISLSIFF